MSGLAAASNTPKCRKELYVTMCNVGDGYRTRSIVTKALGATASRPGLDELLKDCRRRSIDVIVVWKFDRFARSLKNLIAGLELCRALGIDFVSVTEAVDTSLPAGEMLFQMIGAVAQFERSLIAERVKSGLANARANGKILGDHRCAN